MAEVCVWRLRGLSSEVMGHTVGGGTAISGSAVLVEGCSPGGHVVCVVVVLTNGHNF